MRSVALGSGTISRRRASEVSGLCPWDQAVAVWAGVRDHLLSHRPLGRPSNVLLHLSCSRTQRPAGQNDAGGTAFPTLVPAELPSPSVPLGLAAFPGLPLVRASSGSVLRAGPPGTPGTGRSRPPCPWASSGFPGVAWLCAVAGMFRVDLPLRSRTLPFCQLQPAVRAAHSFSVILGIFSALGFPFCFLSLCRVSSVDIPHLFQHYDHGFCLNH